MPWLMRRTPRTRARWRSRPKPGRCRWRLPRTPTGPGRWRRRTPPWLRGDVLPHRFLDHAGEPDVAVCQLDRGRRATAHRDRNDPEACRPVADQLRAQRETLLVALFRLPCGHRAEHFVARPEH